jgi:hypothetical protein
LDLSKPIPANPHENTLGGEVELDNDEKEAKDLLMFCYARELLPVSHFLLLINLF